MVWDITPDMQGAVTKEEKYSDVPPLRGIPQREVDRIGGRGFAEEKVDRLRPSV
jgi:hypothetical protein